MTGVIPFFVFVFVSGYACMCVSRERTRIKDGSFRGRGRFSKIYYCTASERYTRASEMYPSTGDGSRPTHILSRIYKFHSKQPLADHSASRNPYAKMNKPACTQD